MRRTEAESGMRISSVLLSLCCRGWEMWLLFLKSPLGALVLIIAFVLLIELSFRNDKRNSEREKKTE